jgi:glycosyltransferase involved in cell wall biosynthesis
MIEIAAIPVDDPGQPLPDGRAGPHVLILIDQLDRILGGGERIALQIARHLPNCGFRTSILTLSLHPDSPALNRPPCPIYVLPVKRVFSFRGIRSSLALGKFLRYNNIQIVQTFFSSADLWGGFIAKTLSSSKLVWSLRDMGFQRTSKQRLAYRVISGFPDAVFAVSNQVRNESIFRDRIDPGRIVTIHNGVSPEGWPARLMPETSRNAFHVTTVGNIRRIKGHDLFIEAAAQIRNSFPDVTFSIVGDVLEHHFYRDLERRLELLGFHEKFRILSGNIDIPKHLAQSDLFVLPSRSEGFPNAVIEAMASALPVIATDAGGSAEAVRNGGSGLIVPQGDSTALADAISWMISNPSRSRKMGETGRNIVLQEFTTSQMTAKIASVYRSLIS